MNEKEMEIYENENPQDGELLNTEEYQDRLNDLKSNEDIVVNADGSITIVDNTELIEVTEMIGSEVPDSDYTAQLMKIADGLTTLNYTTAALLFFSVFTWVSQKLHNAVKKVVAVE